MASFSSFPYSLLIRHQPPLLELLLGLLIHLIWTFHRLHLDHSPLAGKFIDHRHACLFKGLESLLDGFDVVVCAAGGLAAVEESLLHDGFRAVEKEGEFGGDDGALKRVGLVEFAGESWNSR